MFKKFRWTWGSMHAPNSFSKTYICNSIVLYFKCNYYCNIMIVIFNNPTCKIFKMGGHDSPPPPAQNPQSNRAAKILLILHKK